MKPSNTDEQVEVEVPAEASAEQAADFAALQGMAGPTPGQELAEAEAEQSNKLADEIAGIVQAAVQMLAPMFPSLITIYTPPATQAAAQAVAGVCNKHGWLQGGLMGRWGEEIACAAIVGPLAFATYQGIKGDIAARQPAKAERIGGPDLSAPVPQAPAGSREVTFGAPVPAAA